MNKDARFLAEQWLSTWDHTSEWAITSIQNVDGVTVAHHARKDGAVVVGNVPIIIECESGNVIETGTGRTLEYYIRNYRATGDPHVEAVECVFLFGSTPKLTAVSSARALRGFAKNSMLEAKQISDQVKAGASISVTPMEGVSCEQLLQEVREAGYVAEIVILNPRKETPNPAAHHPDRRS